MKTNKTLIIAYTIAIVAVVVAIGVYYFGNFGQEAANENINQENTNQLLIGGQKDAHGCLIAAGYSWCESKQKCLRIWEEPCYEAEEAELAKIFSSKHNQPLDQTNVKVAVLQDNFASGTISFGPPGSEGGAFLARLADGAWTIDYEGNGSVDCPKIKDLGYSKEVLEGFCD